jgi:copper(I)-binding protein
MRQTAPFIALLALLLPAAARAQLTLADAWVRAMPPTQRVTAAYLTASNSGSAPLVLSVAEASLGGRPLAGRVELHRSAEVDGLMRMQRLDSLTLAPGERVTLTPGGLHLMLLDLARMPAPGETVRLCLGDGSGARSCIDAPVRRDAPPADHAHHH